MLVVDSHSDQVLAIIAREKPVRPAAVLIPVRAFVISLVLFHAPRAREKFLTMWPFLLLFDELWSLAPFLLIHHLNTGVALGMSAALVYVPFAQRSLILMFARRRVGNA